jgi:undecaprenyl-diphosphatase
VAVVPRLLALDHVLRSWIVGHRIRSIDPLMWGLSAAGRGGLVWVVIATVLVAFRQLPVRALVSLALALLLASMTADHVLKPLIGRERPFASAPGIPVIGGRPHDASLPSGHAANAFAAAYVLSSIAPQGRGVWWALALAIAYSRVYVGVHYPYDVIAGAVVGAACGAIVMAWRGREPQVRRLRRHRIAQDSPPARS